jgi:hypothetical protein
MVIGGGKELAKEITVGSVDFSVIESDFFGLDCSPGES